MRVVVGDVVRVVKGVAVDVIVRVVVRAVVVMCVIVGFILEGFDVVIVGICVVDIVVGARR